MEFILGYLAFLAIAILVCILLPTKTVKIVKRQTKPKLKRCSMCRQLKTIGQYHKDKYQKDGVKDRCKKCRAKLYQRRKK